MVDVKLLDRIYGDSLKRGLLPYRIGAMGGVSYGMEGVVHAPGKKGFLGGSGLLDGYKYHGYMGLAVETYAKPVDQQHVELCWAAVDVDDRDNNDCDDLPMYCKEVLEGGEHMVIRRSKSGKGAHIILPFTPVQMSVASARKIAKSAVANTVIKLYMNGVQSCVTGLVNLWLYSEGGKQETIYGM